MDKSKFKVGDLVRNNICQDLGLITEISRSTVKGWSHQQHVLTVLYQRTGRVRSSLDRFFSHVEELEK